jgi:hypothetical protein
MKSEKNKRLLEAINWDYPGLAEVKAARDPAVAFIDHLLKPPRPAFRFEYQAKQAMLAYLWTFALFGPTFCPA